LARDEGPGNKKGDRAPGKRKARRARTERPRRTVFNDEDFAEGFDDIEFGEEEFDRDSREMVRGESVAIPPPPEGLEHGRKPTTPAEEERLRDEEEEEEEEVYVRRAAERRESAIGPTLPEPVRADEVFDIEEEEAPADAGNKRAAERRPARGRPSVRRPSVARNGSRLIMPVVIVAAVATLVVSIIFTKLGSIDYSNFFFFLVIFTLAAHLDMKLKGGGKVNLGLAPLVAALIALPVHLPTITYSKITASSAVLVVWVFLLGTIVTLFTRLLGERTKEDYLGLALNYAGVGLSALVFFLLVKILPKRPELLGRYTPAVLGAAAISVAVLYGVYLLRESYLASAEGQFPPGVYLQSTLRKSWLPYAIVAFTGAAMGLIFVGIGMWSLIIVLPLLLIFMYAYNRVAATDQYLLETIKVLSAIPEETGMLEVGHADRVAELASGVARELGLSPEDAQQVEFAAYLHDIGAVTRHGAQPEQRQLSEVEGVIAGGVDIVGKVDYLDVAAEILGGREGLRDRVTDVDKRRAVSLGAGILRAVDDFESLVQGSESREPLSESDALTEMNLERGVKYDSKVLRAIARVLTRLPREFSSSVEGSPESSPFWGDQES